MDTSRHDIAVEEICYKQKHIEEVLKEISKNFDWSFDYFLKSGGHLLSDDDYEIKSPVVHNKLVNSDIKLNFKRIIQTALQDYESERQYYIGLMNEDSLQEYQDDEMTFKTKELKDRCPIIRRTLQNRLAKSLDKFRAAFSFASPKELIDCVTKLSEFERNYMDNIYNPATYDEIVYYEKLKLTDLDTKSEYTVRGVIGGGIKSHFLYKNYPQAFPNRSRFAVWALWYLTDKKNFKCDYGSEFIMTDLKNNTVQQNYFYPYELFTFYAHQIYLMLKNKAREIGVNLEEKYRYVYVDAFLSSVAQEHIYDISEFTRNVKD